MNSVAAEQGQPGITRSVPIDTLALYREQAALDQTELHSRRMGRDHRTRLQHSAMFHRRPGRERQDRTHARHRPPVVPDRRRAALSPHLLDYVSQAPQLDVLQFAARQGGFGQFYREEGIRLDFEQQLAEAQRTNRLILLVDHVDDLYEEELRVVSQRLAPFQRLILAERTPHLQLRAKLDTAFTCLRSLTLCGSAPARCQPRSG